MRSRVRHRYSPFLIALALIGVGTVAMASESTQKLSTTLRHASVNPSGLSYVPDAVLMGNDETVYLLSRADLGVFRWSVPRRSYTETIDLDSPPSLMAYSPDTDRLYLGYSDLHWEYIDASGVFSTSLDSPYHSSTGIEHPMHVAPDGSAVVLGSGRVYDAITLMHTHTLPNGIDDAAWAGGNLFTLRALEGTTQVEKWGADHGLQATLRLDGTPIRVFAVSEGLLVITYLFDEPWFWILDLDLGLVHQPLHRAFLPRVFSNYCPDFFDDFSNPTSGWYVGENSYVRTEYLNGEYRVLSKRDGYLYLFGAPTCARENYTVELDAHWEGAPGGSYGVLFGLTYDFGHYYFFDINTDHRQFRLYRRSPSGFTQIVAPTYSSAINGGTVSNHLRVTHSGDQITLDANGMTLGTWWDSRTVGLSYVGVVSSPYIGRPTSEARFDNFGAVRLTTTGTGAQSTVGTDVTVCEPASSYTYIEPIGSLEW